ncbi:TQO small subunit DoxD [Acetobacteraceae bacterium ESL0709]|nr:TQO small subunit DoxD [Acetobacteraceae bacterium ESL0697]MDF7677446.1 TQO small subunit DoxD [Acetobacteraceae bacterium ESL0709]
MALTENTKDSKEPPTITKPGNWLFFGLGLLSIRFIQGFIYWGGGSRRFIYAPNKLNPFHHPWMANKFQTAMPGALLGMEHVVSYILQHFWLLYTAVILFSAAELIIGLMLMIGYLTRFAALVSMGFAVLLMLLFGWQGATCIDEWTMAACNLAMGATLLLAGGQAYSVDNYLLKRNPALAQKAWFRLASGALPLDIIPPRTLQHISIGIFAFVALFDVTTYSYYRGSVITPFHGGPTSPTVHHLSLDHALIDGEGNVRFHVYLDAGTPEAPVHVVRASLLDEQKQPIVQWGEKELSALPPSAFVNDYAYNKFMTGPFGIKAPMGAKATITLPCPQGQDCSAAKALRLTDVDGKSFTISLK